MPYQDGSCCTGRQTPPSVVWSAQPCSLSAMIERPRLTHRGVRGRRVRVVAIDLVPELVRTGRPQEAVERSRPETVAPSDRAQPAYQEILERDPGGGVGSGQRCSWQG